MGRPRIDRSAITRPCAQPPPTLSDKMRALWAREFDRFPPGFYVPADVNGMLVYLHVVSEYDAAMARAAAATRPIHAAEARAEVRKIRLQLMALQRALRMYPTTRTKPDRMAGLADNPDAHVQPEATGTPEPAWRGMMREAGALPEGKRTQ